MSATASGYVRESWNEHSNFSTALAVGEGLDSEHVVFRLHRQVVIYGRVTDEHGEPVRHARVMLFRADIPSHHGNKFGTGDMQTDDLGEYRFAHLLAGKYFVTVETRPWWAQHGVSAQTASTSARRTQPTSNPMLDVVYPVTYYPGVTNANAAGELNLKAGEIAEANITLQSVPALHIRLTNLPESVNVGASGTIFGTYVMEYPTMIAAVAPGEIEVAGVPPGEVTLRITENRSHNEEMRTIKLNANGDETVDGRSVGTVNISGRVVIPDENLEITRAVAVVILVREDGQAIASPVKTDGTITFPPQETGTFRVTANGTDSEALYVGSIVAEGAQVNGDRLTVSEAGEVRLTVKMQRGMAQVTGMAKLDGKPAPGVLVVAIPQKGDVDDDSRVDQSDSDGTFTLSQLQPGKYELLALEDGFDVDWTSEEVRKMYREKAQVVDIGASEQKNVEVEVKVKKP